VTSRRDFIGGALGIGALAAAGCQTAPTGERRIVDAQVHLWKAESADWPWVPGMKPQMPEPFTVEKLIPLMDEAGVERAVVVPPSWPGRSQRLRRGSRAALSGPLGGHGSPAAAQSEVRGVAANVARSVGDAGRAAHLSRQGRGNALRRQRRVVLAGGGESRSSGHVPRRRPGAYFGRVAQRHPGLQLIVDHMGLSLSVPAVREGKFEASIADTASLAKYPNISVKLSAAPNYSLQPYPFADMKPHLRRLFDAYGPRRCYWGTDMTNGFGKATYRQRIAHFTETLDFMSEADKDWVMGRAILERLRWT
jgi:hypothetical protein